MALNIPSLSEFGLRYLAVGFSRKANSSFVRSVPKSILKTETVLRVKASDHPQFLRASTRKIGDLVVFFVETAVPEHFRSVPKTSGKKKDIDELIASASGIADNVVFFAKARVTSGELSPGSMIRTLTTPKSIGGVTFHLSAGTIKIENSPIIELGWEEIEDEDDTLEIRAHGQNTCTIGDRYLLEHALLAQSNIRLCAGIEGAK